MIDYDYYYDDFYCTYSTHVFYYNDRICVCGAVEERAYWDVWDAWDDYYLC